MHTPKVRFALAPLVPALLPLSISEAAAQKQSAAAARAECFRQANEAAAAVNIASTAASAERNARGVGLSGLRPTNGNPPLMQCRDTAAASSELQPIWPHSGP